MKQLSLLLRFFHAEVMIDLQRSRQAQPKFQRLARASVLGLTALTICCATNASRAASQIDTQRVTQVAVLLPSKPAGFGRPASDRAVWEKIAHASGFASVVPEAEKLMKRPIPEVTDELFLDFSRSGNRDRCQEVLFARSSRISTLTLAECFENRGRFMPALEKTIEALCAERTWVYPAHDGKLNNFYGRTVEMDLRATAVGRDLATIDHLLGDKLSPPTRRLIRENVQRRILQPFRDMVEGRRDEISWMRVNNNWNAVCLAGVTGAALTLVDSPKERAWFIVAAENYITNFLSGFTPDGYCSEGISYWNYGFGHFIMLAESIRQATSNRIDLLANPAALQPALYATRSEILNGIYPSIADCHPGSQPDPKYLRYLCERFDLDLPAARKADWLGMARDLTATVMFAFLEQPLPIVPHPAIETNSPLRSWFKDGGLLICRTASDLKTDFAAALKGGHNAEHHNHNDVGSFSVVVGNAMVICDPGAEVYTARTFSSRRYDSKVINSFGHAVPVVARELQRAGASAKAVVLRTDFRADEDTLALDIRSAYAVNELTRLERTFVFRRTKSPSLTVRDEVAFTEPKTFETALITWGEWKKVSDSELLISDRGGAARIKIDARGEPFDISAEQLDENVHTPKKPIRVAITLKSPVKDATVTLTILPEKK